MSGNASMNPHTSEEPSVGSRGLADSHAAIENTKYVIVSPVRDEAAYIRFTLKSIIEQTIRPQEWIIVDDGSKDETGRILDEYARQYGWISVVHREDRGKRVAGSGVMEAFYAGYARLRTSDWKFIVKLDGDVGLKPDYFQRCFEHFENDPKLGICGGMMYCPKGDELVLERNPMFHVRGPIKLYRRSCFEEIGGLIKAPGWDTVDEIRANMFGWRTQSVSDLEAIHHRPTGAAAGFWRDNVKNGRADYVSGYHPLFIIAKCIRRLAGRPYVLKSIAHLYGYFSGCAKKMPRVEDRAQIRYVRSQQMRRLFFMKSMWK